MDVYSRAFVDALPPPPGTTALLGRLAARYRLAILSNWPLATTIDRYAEAAGWSPSLAAIVVSQRVGTIKPQPAIFAAAAAALGDPPPRVDPARRRRLGRGRGRGAGGWAGARPTSSGRPADSPLPGSDRGDAADPDLRPDLELEDVFGSRPAWRRWRAAALADLRAAPPPRAPSPRR